MYIGNEDVAVVLQQRLVFGQELWCYTVYMKTLFPTVERRVFDWVLFLTMYVVEGVGRLATIAIAWSFRLDDLD